MGSLAQKCQNWLLKLRFLDDKALQSASLLKGNHQKPFFRYPLLLVVVKAGEVALTLFSLVCRASCLLCVIQRV